MDPMESIRQVFFQECEEQILAMEEGLSAMGGADGGSETVNAVFRAVHSIKGGAGAFGFAQLVRFAHTFESVLDDVRAGNIEPGPEIVKLLIRAGDILADHVTAARDNQNLPVGHGAEIAEQLAALSVAPPSDAAIAEDKADPFGFVPTQIVVDSVVNEVPRRSRWCISFTPHARLHARANDPFLVLRELASLGEARVEADLSRLPPLADLEPEDSYLGWTITLLTDASRDKIEDVFEFVSGDSDVSITLVEHNDTAEAVMSDFRIAPMSAETASDAGNTETGAREAVQEDKSAVPLASRSDASVKQTIRVDLDKVDRLVNLVGELVITQAMLCQGVDEAVLKRNTLVTNGLSELEHLTRELQESVMAIRTQPVKSLFQRMPRLVRDLAHKTNKQVRLVVDGEGTEVDKTVIERLSEPLTHMIRNAIDHGLETPAERLAAGKPGEGTVRLSAEHRGGRIVIEVADDGRGIDRERVREKAIARGLLSEAAALSDEEADNLIFMPGFSTASQISDISGRGVGMDVVRRNIMNLGGRVAISSVPLKGSKFSLTLPLTLAVLDGMIVSVGSQTYVLPLAHIVESLKPRREDVKSFGPERSLLRIRNSYVPLVRIGELLEVTDAKIDPTDGVVILVESEGTGQLALAVDTIVGQQQVVIKSFESNYQHIEGIAAATILGDGRVALILDVDGLVWRCRDTHTGTRFETLKAVGGRS
jgi:two-component system, chemotaxis family, sensor kinase CheA